MTHARAFVGVLAAITCGALAVPAGSLAQGPAGPPPEVATAQAQLQGNDAGAAIATLEEYFRRHPEAAAGRLLLGNAYRAKGDLDRALAAFLAVPPIPRPAYAQARYSAALLHAGRGQRDEALRLLGELAASGAFDMDLAREAPELAPLRDDPRFAAAMFAPEDFVNPFVEPVRVIHEWTGEGRGDQFSWIARGIRDVDGDGVREVVTSAPSFGALGQPSGPGRVYLYSGKSGRLLWMQTGHTTENHSGESLGSGLEAAGDVDADGVADVVAGAPGSDRAYVYSGRDGRPLLTLAAAQPGEGFGNAVCGAGDQNGDGHADLIVGAPGASAAGEGAGRAYVFSGQDGTLLRTLDGEAAGDGFGSIVAGAQHARAGLLLVGAPSAGEGDRGRVYVYAGLTAAPKFVIEAEASGGALGAMFTSVVGDLDGDQVADVFASDFADAGKGPSTGRVYVHSGRDGRRLLTLTGESAGDGFGIGSPDVGDLDRDGFDDLVLGAWQHASAASSGGRIYVFSGKDGRLLRAITGRVPGETLGFDATGVGDVDGDGTSDLLVTSSWSNVKGFRSGRMYVISGAGVARPAAGS
jgi:hypothetical protein